MAYFTLFYEFVNTFSQKILYAHKKRRLHFKSVTFLINCQLPAALKTQTQLNAEIYVAKLRL